MGEAPAFLDDALQNGLSNWDLEKPITSGDKSFAIHGTDDENRSSLGVRVYDKHVNNWLIPVVLGMKPKTCRGHSAILLNEDKVLVICKGSTTDDSIWLLEVNTSYVREQRELLGTEVVAWSKVVKGSAKKPVVISGPSGVGKGTLISMLMKEFPAMFGFSVSHTTRAPRGTEKDGVHYHFTQKAVMEKEIKDGKFLEFASVHGNLYGTSIEAVEVVADSGKRCILDIDVQGARSVRASSIDAAFIFICPPSMKELEDRLRDRGTETEEQIQKRLRNAEAEIEQGKTSGIFDHILYNDNLEDCYKSLKKLLGLAGNSPVDQVTFYEGVNLPEEHTVSKMENKILIEGLGKDSNTSVVLDVSCLNGGAPGRTRGLIVNAIGASSQRSNGFNEFS